MKFVGGWVVSFLNSGVDAIRTSTQCKLEEISLQANKKKLGRIFGLVIFTFLSLFFFMHFVSPPTLRCRVFLHRLVAKRLHWFASILPANSVDFGLLAVPEFPE